MLDENAFISFSQRIQKNVFLSENTNSNLFNLLLKSKKDNNSEKTNESFDFIEKPLNIFNKIEKPKEIITKNYNDKNIINNFEKKVTVRPYHQFIENIANKKIYIKKKLLEQILQNKKIKRYINQ